MRVNKSQYQMIMKRFEELTETTTDQIKKKTMTQIFKRAVQTGGTPVSTERTRPGGPHGELRQSATVSPTYDMMGYSKDYAPHVEFGHRVVVHGKSCGYVPGQYYLKANINKQYPILANDVKNALNGKG